MCRDHTGHQEHFYMREIPFTLVLTLLACLLSCVTASSFSLLSTCKVSQKCRVNAIVARKRELSQEPNLCFWEAWKFPQILQQRKFPDFSSYLYINEITQNICCSFLMKVHNESFQLNYLRFNSTQSKSILTTKVFSYL